MTASAARRACAPSRRPRTCAGPFGTIHLIALYHGAPLPLDAGKIQRRRLLGRLLRDTPRAPYAARALTALQTGAIAVAPLLTHHFPYTAAKDAFDLLYAHSDQALGVILTWPETGSQV